VYARAANAVPSLHLPDASRHRDGSTLGRLAIALRVDGALLTDQAGATIEFGGLATPTRLTRHIGSLAQVATPRLIHQPEDGLPPFVALVPVPDRKGRMQHMLTLWDSRARTPAAAYRLLALAVDMVAQASTARLVRYHEHNRVMFERASQTAHIGIWVCTLPDQRLTWTDGVYDLFELPRGSALDRDATVELYVPESRERMQALRARAIAEHTDFSLDAEIITAKGNRRWMRLTGAVECENGVARRIFGMKQDITEEKLLSDRTRYLAEFDVMTGLANRAQFQARITDLDDVGGLLLIDIDGFKLINDTYGHVAGDDYLKEVARRLRDSCGGASLVARIGGDEFAVLLGRNTTLSDLQQSAEKAVQVLSVVTSIGGQPIPMSASVGGSLCHSAAGEDLFRQADAALYAAKAGGRNTHRIM
jgi:diguanylate cyclase (GGDEF)-like protein/PAS domain S-box-containing protein